MTLLSIANDYGNVDLRSAKLGKRYVVVEGKRLQPICRKLGIAWAPAMTGFSWGRGGWCIPTFCGVVIAKVSEPKLLAEIDSLRQRREKRNARQQERRKKILDEAGIVDGTRTAEWLTKGEVDSLHAQLIQFKAAYRHEHTDYDATIEAMADEIRNANSSHRNRQCEFSNLREDARECCHEDPIPGTWEAYLDKYDFPFPEIALALSKVLRNPKQAHPTWFCKAVLAIKAANIELDNLNYGIVRACIGNF
jgi:hypothetical protein